MDTKEFERLIRGDFRTGDWVRDRTMPWLYGKIIGRGTLGGIKRVLFRIETPRGDAFIPVGDAVAQGIMDCRPEKSLKSAVITKSATSREVDKKTCKREEKMQEIYIDG